VNLIKHFDKDGESFLREIILCYVYWKRA